MTEELAKKENYWLAPAIVLGIMLAAYFAIRIVGATGSVSEAGVVDPVAAAVQEMEDRAEQVGAELARVDAQAAVIEAKREQYSARLDCIKDHSRRLVSGAETEAIACEPQVQADTERFTEAQQ